MHEVRHAANVEHNSRAATFTSDGVRAEVHHVFLRQGEGAATTGVGRLHRASLLTRADELPVLEGSAIDAGDVSRSSTGHSVHGGS